MLKKNIAIANFFSNFLISFVGIFIPLYLLDLGFNGMQLGILISMTTVTSIIFTFPSGKFMDEIPIRKVMITGFIFAGMFYFVLSSVHVFWILVIFFIMGGVGGDIIRLSMNALVYKTVGKKHESDYGFFEFLTSSSMALGFFLGGILIMILNFGSVFKIIALSFFALALFALWLPKTRASHSKMKSYGRDFFKKEVLVLALVLFLSAIHWGAESTSYSPFLRQFFGLNTMQMGIYMAIPMLWLAVISYHTGKKIEKHLSAKKGLYLGLLLSGIGLIGMTYPVLWVSFLLRIVHEIGDGIIVLLVLVDVNRLFKTKRIGGDAGIMQTLLIFASFIGALIFGPIGTAYNFSYPFIISGIITLIALGIAILYSDYLVD